jgi:hypothetical protein
MGAARGFIMIIHVALWLFGWRGAAVISVLRVFKN